MAAAVAAEWQARKRLAPGVTTREIDGLFERARFTGAMSGKVCGAGGGGCLFCVVDPVRRHEVATALLAAGATVLPFTRRTPGAASSSEVRPRQRREQTRP